MSKGIGDQRYSKSLRLWFHQFWRAGCCAVSMSAARAANGIAVVTPGRGRSSAPINDGLSAVLGGRLRPHRQVDLQNPSGRAGAEQVVFSIACPRERVERPCRPPEIARQPMLLTDGSVVVAVMPGPEGRGQPHPLDWEEESGVDGDESAGW